jgi:endonuclease YncB( thermonuclease family)
VLALGLAPPAFAAECPAGGTDRAEVAGAVDGATLLLKDGAEIRLAGIEAPLPPLTLDAGAQWPAAESARQALERLAAGHTVSLAEAGNGPDRHGRTHAYAFLDDGRNLAAALLSEGAVRVRWFQGENECFPAFLAAETAARAVKSGIWSLAEYAVLQANDPSLKRRNGLYDLVEGRVISVGHGSRMIFLDFGQDIRRDFTVMVTPAVADALAAKGHPADSFSGRRVLVRGLIEESNGPAIRLNDPAEIELLDE